MIKCDPTKLNFDDGAGCPLFAYDTGDIMNDFINLFEDFGQTDEYVQALGFVLFCHDDLPAEYNNWIFISTTYSSIYELGQYNFEQLKKRKILVLESLDRKMTCKVKLVQEHGVTGILVTNIDQKFNRNGKARVMPVYEIENYLAQFVMTPKWMQVKYGK